MKLVNQQLIKNTNMKHLYASIYSNPGISRTNLAKLTHLSKTTVSTLVDELIEREFILDSGTGESDSIGRKPNCLQVRMNSYYTVVLNWVENTVYTYLIDIAGTSIYEEERQLGAGDTYISCSASSLYDSVLKQCNSNRILGVCVVVSAMIDALHNEVYSTTLSLPSMGKENLIDALQNAFPEYPVAFLEDTACYAYAEKVYAGITEKNFAFLNFSRGIGATLFIEGKMLGKASGSFTQFGHYSVDSNGPLCVCGNHGCLETLIAEKRLKNRIPEFGTIPSLSNQDTVTFADLCKAATFRDPTALSMMRQMAWELAQALGNLICVVNPSLIILGGKIPALGEIFLEEVREDLKKVGFRKMVDAVTIRYSTLQSDSFLNGAMKYFFDIHYCFTSEDSSSFFIG
ncbi:MAG: ROK family transcriptional regulator [Clostridia bacterium]|nr:ROK family transcriptional regulator [Clostridia bacterium]NCC43522.1 ROK family transcriptional regulator [Clostridia bacterium]